MNRAAKETALAATMLIFAAGAIAAHRRPQDAIGSPAPARADAPRPAGGQLIPAGASIQAALLTAASGAIFWLQAGVYPGPVTIDRAVTLWGPRGAIIRSNGSGNTVVVRTDNARVLGFTIDGSGHRYDKMDAGLLVRGTGIEVRGITIRNTLYGIVIEHSKDLRIIGNDIAGDIRVPLGLRGDGIRLFGSGDCLIAGNRIENSRDLLVWFSPNARIIGNLIEGGRYATHFMFSNGGLVERNRYLRNTVGVFVMYSDHIRIAGNVLAGNMKFDGFGVGAKESGNITIDGNRLVQDRVGIYFDTCPFHPHQKDLIRHNLLALCGIAVDFLGSGANNIFEDNTLRDNQTQVQLEEQGNLMQAQWSGNYFDDYQGYDLDGDGFGDVPYEPRSLSGQLLSEHPGLAFFRGTAALNLIDAVADVMPIFRPEPLLIDRRPRMRPLDRPGPV
ncbi:MAG: nitrous oxide reductase family maturation protein NosD [Candidatus Binataceae bacterium]